MVTNSGPKKRPYELTGPTYALWYDVGQLLGLDAQSAVFSVLCDGSMKLPAKVDPRTAHRIQQIAAVRGVKIT